MYDCVQDVLDQVHIAPTSAGVNNSVKCPEGARGFWVSVSTQDAIVSFDGTDATQTNGLRLKQGVQPIYLPIPRDLSFIGNNATASDVFVIWVR